MNDRTLTAMVVASRPVDEARANRSHVASRRPKVATTMNGTILRGFLAPRLPRMPMTI